jgi:hypothetical protein
VSIDEVVAELNGITDWPSLLAFVTPLRLPTNLSDFDKGRLQSAYCGAATRAWKERQKFPA